MHVVVAARVFHLPHGHRAVIAHAREHDAKRVAPHHRRSGLEEHLDRGLVAIDRRAIVHHRHIVGATAGHMELGAARRDVGVARQNALAIHRLLDGDLAQPVQAGRKTGGEPGGHVLGDDDRG